MSNSASLTPGNIKVDEAAFLVTVDADKIQNTDVDLSAALALAEKQIQDLTHELKLVQDKNLELKDELAQIMESRGRRSHRQTGAAPLDRDATVIFQSFSSESVVPTRPNSPIEAEDIHLRQNALRRESTILIEHSSTFEPDEYHIASADLRSSASFRRPYDPARRAAFSGPSILSRDHLILRRRTAATVPIPRSASGVDDEDIVSTSIET